MLAMDMPNVVEKMLKEFGQFSAIQTLRLVNNTYL